MTESNDFGSTAIPRLKPVKITELTHELEVLMPGAEIRETTFGAVVDFRARVTQDTVFFPNREDALRYLRVIVERFQNEILYRTGAQFKVNAWQEEIRETRQRNQDLQAQLGRSATTIQRLSDEVERLNAVITDDFQENQHMIGDEEE